CLHHFVGYPAEEQGIGLREFFGPVTVRFFVRHTCTMIAASVQRDIDGIPKGSHDVLLKRANAAAQPRGPKRAASRFPRSDAARVGCSGLLGVSLARKDHPVTATREHFAELDLAILGTVVRKENVHTISSAMLETDLHRIRFGTPRRRHANVNEDSRGF